MQRIGVRLWLQTARQFGSELLEGREERLTERFAGLPNDCALQQVFGHSRPRAGSAVAHAKLPDPVRATRPVGTPIGACRNASF